MEAKSKVDFFNNTHNLFTKNTKFKRKIITEIMHFISI